METFQMAAFDGDEDPTPLVHLGVRVREGTETQITIV